MRLKAVELMVLESLPEDIRGSLSGMDARGLEDILAAVADKHPDKYEDISHKLSKIGLEASYWQGETLSLSDAKPVIDKQAILDKMNAEVAALKATTPDEKEFKSERGKIWSRYSDLLQKATMDAALKQGNNLGYSVASGARGKPEQVKAMLSTPALYEDAKGDTVPLFIRNGFNSGLRPYEYLAGTYGARATVVSTKAGTAKGGYLGKLMGQAMTPLIVSEEDCEVDNGVDYDLDDDSLRGRVLARPVGDWPAGTLIDRAVMADLRKKKVEGVVARSALTCQSEEGICAKCTGLNVDGKMPTIGEAVGITSSQALAEPLAQSALSAKHSGGQAGAKREYSGFDVINRFVQTPEQFEDRAVVSEIDGKVTSVDPAPQGGTYVTVNDQKHYVLPGYPVTASVGEVVEAGDQLADGLGDPGDIVRLKGLGEGRRYYSRRLSKIFQDSGIPGFKRDTEMLARAALNHMSVSDDDGLDGVLPDDVVSYSRVRSLYTPPEDTKDYDPKEAIGKYLQKDALHYTIGTRITPSVAKRLGKVNWGKISASETPPPFKSEMIRLQSASHNNPDWLASQHTSYLRKQLSEDAARGRTTNVESNTHFVPRLAIGKDFGESISTTGKF